MTTFNNDFLTRLAHDGGTMKAPVGFKINDVAVERGDQVQFLGMLNGYSLANLKMERTTVGAFFENVGILGEAYDVNNDGKADEIFYHGGLAYAKLGE